MQQLIPLINGNGIKITTAYYYIKSGRCIHKKSNDKILLGKEISTSDITAEEELNLKQIYKTVKNREVYGGGGITPDIEIQGEPMTNLAMELRRHNTFFNFAVDYMVEKDHSIDRNFVVDDALMNRFLTYASARHQIPKLIWTAPAPTSALCSKVNCCAPLSQDLEAYKTTIQLDRQFTEPWLF